MSEPQNQNEAACGGSDLTAELGADRDIVDRLRDSQPEGTEGGLLLNDAADEIDRLREELKGWHDFGRAIAACAGNFTVLKVPNA